MFSMFPGGRAGQLEFEIGGLIGRMAVALERTGFWSDCCEGGRNIEMLDVVLAVHSIYCEGQARLTLCIANSVYELAIWFHALW